LAGNYLTKTYKKERRKTMEWIIQNWFIVVLGLIAVTFLLGNKSKRSKEDTDHVEGLGTDSEGKKHKSGHGCCH
jgi:hypothetical protein